MAYLRNLALFGAFIAGYFCPWAASLNWLIRWLIVGMMFMVMLQVKFTVRSIRVHHLIILLANIAVGMGGWGIFMLAGNRELAEVAFFTGITPTATAAPVIVGLLGERVDYAVSAFLATNLGMAVLFPFLIPIAIGNPAPTVFADVIGNASQFLREQQANLPPGILWKIAVVSLLICIVNFAGGRMIGGKKFFRESSQVLGQKNTTLTIFLAITYANPLIALGPTFYVIWHNGWNAWQLQMRTFRERKKRRRVTLLKKPQGNV